MADTRIDPKTGRRRDWVDPRAAQLAAAREGKELQQSIAILKRQKMALESRENLLTFTKFTMPDPEHPNDVERTRYDAQEFHKGVADALEAVERGEMVQLIFCMPPRHGKTELATKRFAAWYMGKHPEHDVAVASYSDTMAEDMGADTRAILSSKPFLQIFPGFKLRRGGTAKNNIQTDKGGRAVFVGRGGALTGRGANLLLIDDLFKDHEEARSQAVRDQAWNWFTKVAMTRRMGKKLVVVTMTRWHSDDIIGRITDPENPQYNAIEAAKWKIIRLPAIAEEDDPLGREPGEVLWKERYDLDFMESQQRLDPLGFAALYQQRPTVADGVLFRRENIRRYAHADLPEDLRYYAASDHAVGTKQRNDPSCFILIGVSRNDDIYVIDCDWRRMPADAAVEAMLTMGSGTRKPLIWWAERGHISKSIGPFLNKRMMETGRYMNVVEVTPIGDKEQRAQSIAARVSMGKVLFPVGPMWAERAIDEMLSFPMGLHDDFVDAMSLVGLGLGSQFGASKPAVKKEPPKFGTLGWVKFQDKWAADQRAERAAGGF
jgi:predicted phage terminase large subunit-like protein